jgi:hypothetical protein
MRGQVNLAVENLRTPGGGMFNLPSLGLSKVQVKGALGDNRLNIAEAVLGGSSDPFSGSITGDVELTPSPSGGFLLGQYRLNLDVALSAQFEKDFALIKAFIGSYQVSSGPEGSRYRFSAQGQGVGQMPKFSAPLAL